MTNQIEIVKDIADGMIGIGGVPSNEEFYAEFDMRVRAALHIPKVVGRSEQLKAFAHFLKWKREGYISYSTEEEMVNDYKESL